MYALILTSFHLLCVEKAFSQYAASCLLHQLRNLNPSYYVSELFFKIKNDPELTHLNASTFTSFTHVLHIYMKYVPVA